MRDSVIKVSVIIPSYRPGGYLIECLNSLCGQTFRRSDFEIIIVLNGCDEPYRSLVASYLGSHKDWQFRFFQTDQGGVSNARNIGIENARGEYITFVDDDDIVSPSYLEDLFAVSSPVCVGCSNSYAFCNCIEERAESFLTKAFNRCKKTPYSLYSYRQFLSPPVCKLIHRDIIGSIRFPVSLKKSEDSVFCLQLSPRIKEMKMAEDAAIYYQRLRAGSAMRTKHSLLNEFCQLLKIEFAYVGIWIKNPFIYDCKFLLSRMAAGLKNFWFYVR